MLDFSLSTGLFYFIWTGFQKETTDAIARLLKMKERYKEITGSEYKLTEDNTKDKKVN